MAVVVGVNAVFHDPAAALVVDGVLVAAAEEERFTRRKHGKSCVPFSTWEVPDQALAWCLASAGLTTADVDAVAYSYDPSRCASEFAELRVPAAVGAGGGSGASADRPETTPHDGAGHRASWDPWEQMRTLYAHRAADFLHSAFPGLPPTVHHVPHHVAHAASAYYCSPFDDCAVLVMDGRGETTSHLSGDVRRRRMTTLASQLLPQSLGLLYEEVTEHLGFRRSSDEYKVMALASYGDRRTFAAPFDRAVHACADGGFAAARVDLGELVPKRRPEDPWDQRHADLAAAMQAATERLLLEMADWLHRTTHHRDLAMAGGVALNCVANGRLAAEGPFDRIFVQPAAGDAGTALGAALHVAQTLGDEPQPMTTAALGRSWNREQIRDILRGAELPFEEPDDLAAATADVLANDGVVGWFEGRSEFGPRALGHRSLLVDPRREENLQRMNHIKGREEFRPVAPMVLLERFSDVFEGVCPSPYMLFVHTVRPEWRDRIPAVVHVDGTARVQTVDRREEPLMAAVLEEFERRTGVPVLVNTSFNTAGRPMVDSPVDALECFGSGPIELLVLAPFALRRTRRTGGVAP